MNSSGDHSNRHGTCSLLPVASKDHSQAGHYWLSSAAQCPRGIAGSRGVLIEKYSQIAVVQQRSRLLVHVHVSAPSTALARLLSACFHALPAPVLTGLTKPIQDLMAFPLLANRLIFSTPSLHCHNAIVDLPKLQLLSLTMCQIIRLGRTPPANALCQPRSLDRSCC